MPRKLTVSNLFIKVEAEGRKAYFSFEVARLRLPSSGDAHRAWPDPPREILV
jgi:hypothetical protein